MRDRERYRFRLLAYVFMPDHAHFIVVPAKGRTISATMRVIKGGIARVVNQSTERKGTVWQGGFFDRVATTLDQLNAYIGYVHNNPVKAGFVTRAEDFVHSSAGGDCMLDYQEFLNEERA
jgi:REP element-mobilizing transposase RayT